MDYYQAALYCHPHNTTVLFVGLNLSFCQTDKYIQVSSNPCVLFYLKKKQKQTLLFIIAKRDHTFELCVTVLQTWVQTLRCSRCCLYRGSGRLLWFPEASLRTGRTTGRTFCGRMSPELKNTNTAMTHNHVQEREKLKQNREQNGVRDEPGGSPVWEIKSECGCCPGRRFSSPVSCF